jgi:copper chaperone CopZ
VPKVLKALEELPGVKSVDVSLFERKATVAFDPSFLSVTDMCHALIKAGYFATPFEDDSQPPRLGSEPHSTKQGTEKINLICHCFNYSAQDIEDDFAENGRSLIMERIIAAKKAGACDCANRNPTGK